MRPTPRQDKTRLSGAECESASMKAYWNRFVSIILLENTNGLFHCCKLFLEGSYYIGICLLYSTYFIHNAFIHAALFTFICKCPGIFYIFTFSGCYLSLLALDVLVDEFRELIYCVYVLTVNIETTTGPPQRLLKCCVVLVWLCCVVCMVARNTPVLGLTHFL